MAIGKTNAGGAMLNFKVVGGTTAPGSPTENTIWVKTSNTVPSWHFGADEPNVFSVKLRDPLNTRWLLAPHALKAGDILNFTIPATVSDDLFDINITDPITGKTYAVRQYGGTAGGAWPEGTRVGLKISNDLNPVEWHYYEGTAYVSSWGANYHEEGTIWFPTGTVSEAKFNALKKNELAVTPTAAKQYIGGAWVNQIAHIYKPGGWVQFSSEFAATIAVTYPEGSTLTCTDGNTTLTATTTTGSYTFTVPNAGSWTVTATSGSNSASQTVSITADGQSEQVELRYS